ncbi:MAG: methyltransferase domain-containing protein [Thermodesulfobacteriota bacterium]
MAEHVCPWWLGYLLSSPLRRLWHNPEKTLGPHVREGMTVLDIGPGMGFFSIPAARMVGARGRVIAVDLQEKMLQGLARRANQAGVAERIELRVCSPKSLGVNEPVDVCLAFNVVHEVPDPQHLLAEIRALLRPTGRLLLSEPGHHVSEADFRRTLELASEAGLRVIGDLGLRSRMTAVCEPASGPRTSLDR